MGTAGGYAPPAAVTPVRAGTGTLVLGQGTPANPWMIAGSRWVASAVGSTSNAAAQAAAQPVTPIASFAVVKDRRYRITAYTTIYQGAAGWMWACIFGAPGSANPPQGQANIRRYWQDYNSGNGAYTAELDTGALLGGTDLPAGPYTARLWIGGGQPSTNYAPNQLNGTLPARIDVYEYLV